MKMFYERMFGVLLAALLVSMPAFAQTTEFTYQGKLNDAGGQAANYDFEFRLCATESASCTTPIATVLKSGVTVSTAGIFTVNLDFGASNLNGANRFMEIAVRRAGTPAYTTLAPRQKLTSVPYAVQALNTESFGNLGVSDFVHDNDPRVQPNNYVQNSTTAQTNVNFNIGGTGSANVFNATTQFNIGGSRILTNSGTNLLVGLNSGTAGSGGGSGNSFIGNSSGAVNAGSNNTSVGGDTGGGKTNTANFNSFFGFQAGNNNNSGAFNTLIGAGSNIALTGNNNTLLGALTFLNGGLNNATAIGFRASATQSNSLILGGVSGVNGATANTLVGIGTTAPAFKLQVVDTSNTGLRVQTNTVGGTVASFGSNGKFQVDAPNVEGGRLTVLENGNVGIGDTTPDARLSVNGNGTNSTALEISSGAIKVTGAGVGTFTPVLIIERRASNSCGDANLLTVIDSPFSNNDPNAILFVTTILPGFTPINTTPVTLYYAVNDINCPQFNNKWVIRMSYGGNLEPVRFNVMIIKR